MFCICLKKRIEPYFIGRMLRHMKLSLVGKEVVAEALDQPAICILHNNFDRLHVRPPSTDQYPRKFQYCNYIIRFGTMCSLNLQ